MKKALSSIVLILIATTFQMWAEGSAESSNRLHPGAKMILEDDGFVFDSNDNPIAFANHKIIRFPNEDDTNTNPHSYSSDTIYITNFDVNQWIDNSVLATTGHVSRRRIANTVTGSMFGNLGTAANSHRNGTRIFIADIQDNLLRGVNSEVNNALLNYRGTQAFRMADGSSQVFPVFMLVNFLDDLVSGAIRYFNEGFEAGIFREENGYQYSQILNRVFARDIATGSELLGWIDNQWVVLMGDYNPYRVTGSSIVFSNLSGSDVQKIMQGTIFDVFDLELNPREYNTDLRKLTFLETARGQEFQDRLGNIRSRLTAEGIRTIPATAVTLRTRTTNDYLTTIGNYDVNRRGFELRIGYNSFRDNPPMPMAPSPWTNNINGFRIPNLRATPYLMPVPIEAAQRIEGNNRAVVQLQLDVNTFAIQKVFIINVDTLEVYAEADYN